MTVRIRRVTTTRAGGVSAPPFDTFNLGDHVGDDPAAVAANRKRLAAAIGLGDDGVVWMNQVHGDHVVVVNAGSVKLTGQKESQKLFRRHSGFECGLREERAVDVRKRQPVRLVEEAVRGMLPKTKMGDAMYRKLKVYSGAEHPHTAQQPKTIEVA